MSFTVYGRFLNNLKNLAAPCVRNRLYSTVASGIQNKDCTEPEVTIKDTTFQSKEGENQQDRIKKIAELAQFRFIFPEFLSDPKYEFRNKVSNKLERMDMLRRRSVIHIPEFYVGSILAVTATDAFSPGKQKRFVGICIQRTYCALRATFTLRNMVDNNGVEIMYDMYNPTILKIEVLRLEKRLDEELFYLRDAYPEYSTFDFDMEPEFQPEGEPVPVNPLKVKLKPYPWHVKWEQRNMRGIESTDDAPLWKKEIARRVQKPWEKYDLMKEYRICVPEEEQVEIWQEVAAHKDKFPTRKHVWKKTLLKAPTTPNSSRQ